MSFSLNRLLSQKKASDRKISLSYDEIFPCGKSLSPMSKFFSWAENFLSAKSFLQEKAFL
jgi:hypothetical protein